MTDNNMRHVNLSMEQINNIEQFEQAVFALERAKESFDFKQIEEARVMYVAALNRLYFLFSDLNNEILALRDITDGASIDPT